MDWVRFKKLLNPFRTVTIFTCAVILIVAAFSSAYYSVIYAQNPWNLQRNTSTNDLDFYLNSNGISGANVQLKSNGTTRIMGKLSVGSTASPNSYTLFVPGVTSDTAAAGYFGNSLSGYSQWALIGESNTGVGVYGVSASSHGIYGTSTSSYAIAGRSTNSIGIYGQGNNNAGVYGDSTGGTGVYGNSTSGNGVIGLSVSGNGVYGLSTNASGLLGKSTNSAGAYVESTNSIALQAQSLSSANWTGWFNSVNSPYVLYARAGGAGEGWTTQIDRASEASITAGGVLLLQNYAPPSTNGYFIYATSDANNNWPGVDLEFAVRDDGRVSTDGAFVPNGADIAEWTPTKYAKDLEPGDLVMVDGSSPDSLTKKSDGTPYSSKLMGIISTDPGFISGGGEAESVHGEKDVMVTLAGRVPTKVSLENGPIEPGDFLTSSSTPGVAMKATKSGLIVGKALESFNASGIGKIIVWVQPLWYGGDEMLQKVEDQQTSIDQLKKEVEELKKSKN